ncbi:MAG: thioredoxin family protein [Pirellulales bacterium]
MGKFARVWWLVVVMSTGAGASALADEPASVAWHTDMASAWSKSCQHGRPLLLFVTCENCKFCDRMKGGTYSRPEVAEMINRSFVPLVLDGRSESPLVKELKVSYYPSTFIISPQAVILARFDGYVSPEDLARRLTVLQMPSSIPNVAQGQ